MVCTLQSAHIQRSSSALTAYSDTRRSSSDLALAAYSAGRVWQAAPISAALLPKPTVRQKTSGTKKARTIDDADEWPGTTWARPRRAKGAGGRYSASSPSGIGDVLDFGLHVRRPAPGEWVSPQQGLLCLQRLVCQFLVLQLIAKIYRYAT